MNAIKNQHGHVIIPWYMYPVAVVVALLSYFATGCAGITPVLIDVIETEIDKQRPVDPATPEPVKPKPEKPVECIAPHKGAVATSTRCDKQAIHSFAHDKKLKGGWRKFKFTMKTTGVGDAFNSPTQGGAIWILVQGLNEKGEVQNFNCTVGITKGKHFVNATVWMKTPGGKKEGAKQFKFQFDSSEIYTFVVTVGKTLTVSVTGGGRSGKLGDRKPLTFSAPFASVKKFDFGSGFYAGARIGLDVKTQGRVSQLE